jgi:predicted enzyme related to lactoylglutathione lyase
MLGNSRVTPTISVTDLERAKEFYENKIGLKLDPSMNDKDGVLYNAGEGTGIYIYLRSNPPKADHTLVSFKVKSIEESINELSHAGVVFEHYDMPGLKTDDKGIAVMGKAKSAWFKDPDGNILSILEM